MNPETETNMETTTGETLVKGAIGLMAAAQGVAINNLKDVNVVLQTVSLTLGIIVAATAVVSIVRKWK